MDINFKCNVKKAIIDNIYCSEFEENERPIKTQFETLVLLKNQLQEHETDLQIVKNLLEVDYWNGVSYEYDTTEILKKSSQYTAKLIDELLDTLMLIRESAMLQSEINNQ